MHTPRDVTVAARGVVLGAQDRHVVPGGQRASELAGVDLRSRLVAGQKVVDRVKDTQMPIIAPCQFLPTLPLQRRQLLRWFERAAGRHSGKRSDLHGTSVTVPRGAGVAFVQRHASSTPETQRC